MCLETAPTEAILGLEDCEQSRARGPESVGVREETGAQNGVRL